MKVKPSIILVLGIALGGLVCFFAKNDNILDTSRPDAARTRALSLKKRIETSTAPQGVDLNRGRNVGSPNNQDFDVTDGLESFLYYCDNFGDLDSNVRFHTLTAALNSAINGGHSEEVFRALLSHFGPGRARNHLFKLFFMGVTNPAEANYFYSKLEFDGDKEAAKKGILQMIQNTLVTARSVDPDFLGKFPALKDDFGTVKRQAALTVIHGDYRDQVNGTGRSNLENSLANLHNFGLNSEDKRYVLREVSSILPYEAWEQIIRDNNATSADLEVVALRMAGKDPQKAVLRVLRGDPGLSIAPQVVRHWLEFDQKASFDWIQENRAELSAAKKDAISAAVVDFAISESRRDFDSAFEWVNEIKDVTLRNELQVRVEEASSAHKGQ